MYSGEQTLMNKLSFIVLSAFMIVIAGISCKPATVNDEYTQLLKDDLNLAKSEVQNLNQRVAKLESDYKALQANNDKLQKDKDKLQADYKNLQDDYDKFLERARKPDLKNVTWAEVTDILKRDNTDKLEYKEGVFDCEGFALTLRDRLARYGIRCAFVALEFPEEAGHALNAFETTDKGIIFIDEVGNDQVAYVEKGKPYGAICLDAVKSDYIACEGKPGEFWGELVWKKYSNPFSYDYYQLIIQRAEFLEQSAVAYNKAVDEFNSGYLYWTEGQINNWRDNLKALKQDLGSCATKPDKAVQNIEIYWN
jgi:cell division protein FtsL